MEKFNYSVIITGSGTYEEILKSLKDVIKSIEATKGDVEKLDDAEWEDSTLMTSINEIGVK
jgi:hypothetical protein